MESNSPSQKNQWRYHLHEIIFEADTAAGRLFDVILLWMIVLSVFTVMLDSIESIQARWGTLLRAAEWGFTILFTIEYLLRIISVNKPSRYLFSFFGLVDFISIVPTYLSLLLPGGHYLMVVRTLRLLRVFRVLKLVRYSGAASVLIEALRASRPKIAVFLFGVSTLVVIVGSLIYLIEGRENGFSSIPTSIYWAIVTLTTVGYGDITPKTPLGQTLSAVVMITGYAIIAVPTGIVSVELSKATQTHATRHACPDCGRCGHASDAKHCKYCGGIL